MFSAFIDEKGIRPLAAVCGVSPSTVHVWKHRNRIPRSRWDAIIKAYKLKDEHLVDMDYASRQSVAA